MNGNPGRLSARKVEEAVGRHYSAMIGLESERLLHSAPVEFAITKRYLRRWIPAHAVVADIGVGVGHYAEALARRGCSLHLIDISQQMLEATCERLTSGGYAGQIMSISRASATNVATVESGSCDAVLLLGPLYHLLTNTERQAAVGGAARVLKKGGVLFAAGINRLAYFRDLIRSNPLAAAKRDRFHRQFLCDGNLDPEHAPGIGFAHLTTIADFRNLLHGSFTELAMVGVESFSGAWQKNLCELPPSELDAWLAVVEQTGLTLEGVAGADHFLFVGTKLQADDIPA